MTTREYYQLPVIRNLNLREVQFHNEALNAAFSDVSRRFGDTTTVPAAIASAVEAAKFYSYVKYPDYRAINHSAPGAATIKSLIDAASTTDYAAIILRNNSGYATTRYNFGNTLSIPRNIAFFMEHGAILTPSSDASITFRGPFDADPTQHFDWKGAGFIYFGASATDANLIKCAHPEWWGAIPDGTTDCEDPIEYAFRSFDNTGGVVQLLTGTYYTAGTINMNTSKITLRGIHRKSSIINAATGVTPVLRIGSDIVYDALLHDFQVTRTALDGSGAEIGIQWYHYANLGVMYHMRVAKHGYCVDFTDPNPGAGAVDIGVHSFNNIFVEADTAYWQVGDIAELLSEYDGFGENAEAASPDASYCIKIIDQANDVRFHHAQFIPRSTNAATTTWTVGFVDWHGEYVTFADCNTENVAGAFTSTADTTEVTNLMILGGRWAPTAAKDFIAFNAATNIVGLFIVNVNIAGKITTIAGDKWIQITGCAIDGTTLSFTGNGSSTLSLTGNTWHDDVTIAGTWSAITVVSNEFRATLTNSATTLPPNLIIAKNAFATASDAKSNQLGTWVSGTYNPDNTYGPMGVDGFVTATIRADDDGDAGRLEGKTDSASPPVTMVTSASVQWDTGIGIVVRYNSLTMPVKANEYWRVDSTDTAGATEKAVYWIPLH